MFLAGVKKKAFSIFKMTRKRSGVVLSSLGHRRVVISLIRCLAKIVLILHISSRRSGESSEWRLLYHSFCAPTNDTDRTSLHHATSQEAIGNLERNLHELIQTVQLQKQQIEDLKNRLVNQTQSTRDEARLKRGLNKTETGGPSRERIKISKGDDGKEYLDPSFDHNGTFCLSWNTSSDEWWTHHVEWRVTRETDDGYCFSLIESSEKRNLLRKLYNIQFHGDCEQAHTKRMWSSGWGVDFANVIDGLKYALETNQPTTIANTEPWHYAAKRDGSRPVCPEMGLSCYFLPLTRCEADPSKIFQGNWYYHNQVSLMPVQHRWLTSYTTRPQTWLRKAVYEFAKKIHLTAPCSVIHIRRSDVLLDPAVRRYFAVEDYMNATDKMTKNVFLLTDDNNAIKEAKAKYPNHNWVVIERPRFKGSEGGWGAHIPSDDPKLEVIVLLSIFREAPKCGVFVHGHSNLAQYIAAVMKSARGKNFVRVDLNRKLSLKVYSPLYVETLNLSRSDWN